MILERKKSKKVEIADHTPLCPACRSVVKGDKRVGYFCSNCNLLFKRKDILFKVPIRHTKKPAVPMPGKPERRSHVSEKLNKIIRETHPLQDEIPEPPQRLRVKPKAQPIPEPVPKPPTPPKPIKEEFELEEESKIIASAESKKMHSGTCHFIKKIHRDNRIYFDSVEKGEAGGKDMCVCLRKLAFQKG